MSYSKLIGYPTPSTTLGIYAILRDRDTGLPYNMVSGATETWVDASIANYVTVLDFVGGDNYGLEIPSDLPHGNYKAIFYKPTVVGTPDITDLKLPSDWEFRWVGIATDPVAPGTPSSDLIQDFAKFLRRWGTNSVTEVSDKDHEGAIQYSVIQDAFDYADSEVYRALTGGPYVVPLDFESVGGVVSVSVEEWAFVLAYSHMYYGRFDDDAADEIDIAKQRTLGSKVKNMVEVVYADMLEVRMGFKQVPGLTAGTAMDMSPQVVSDYDVQKNYLDDYTHE